MEQIYAQTLCCRKNGDIHKMKRFSKHIKILLPLTAFVVGGGVLIFKSVVSPRYELLPLQGKPGFHLSIGYGSTQKLKFRGINLTLQQREDSDFSAGEPFTLIATFSAGFEVSRARVQWSIPQEFEILGGVENFEIGPLRPNEQQVFEITLKTNTEENRQIHIMISSDDGHRPFVQTAQFNTTATKIIADEAEALQLRAKSAIRKKMIQEK